MPCSLPASSSADLSAHPSPPVSQQHQQLAFYLPFAKRFRFAQVFSCVRHQSQTGLLLSMKYAERHAPVLRHFESEVL